MDVIERIEMLESVQILRCCDSDFAFIFQIPRESFNLEVQRKQIQRKIIPSEWGVLRKKKTENVKSLLSFRIGILGY